MVVDHSEQDFETPRRLRALGLRGGVHVEDTGVLVVAISRGPQGERSAGQEGGIWVELLPARDETGGGGRADVEPGMVNVMDAHAYSCFRHRKRSRNDDSLPVLARCGGLVVVVVARLEDELGVVEVVGARLGRAEAERVIQRVVDEGNVAEFGRVRVRSGLISSQSSQRRTREVWRRHVVGTEGETHWPWNPAPASF